MTTEIVAVRKILTPFEVFDYDGTTCPSHYGRIRHELEQAGQAIGAMDLLIAAHALALAATLVTNNLAHFQRISGLSVTRAAVTGNPWASRTGRLMKCREVCRQCAITLEELQVPPWRDCDGRGTTQGVDEAPTGIASAA